MSIVTVYLYGNTVEKKECENTPKARKMAKKLFNEYWDYLDTPIFSMEFPLRVTYTLRGKEIYV